MWFELILAAVCQLVRHLLGLQLPKERASSLKRHDRYLAIIETIPLPEKAVQAFIARIRAWAENDDGKPVYMFNLIHFFLESARFPARPSSRARPNRQTLRDEKVSPGCG